MSGGDLQLALRETQRQIANPRVLAAIAIVALLLGFSGPFGSFEALGAPARIVYWAVVVSLSYIATTTIGGLLAARYAARLQPPLARVLAVGTVAGLPVTALVVAVNLATFGMDTGWRVVPLPWLWLYVTLIIMGVTAISLMIRRTQPSAAAAEVPPALLERLPLPQRGTLISLSVADHYVEVTTSRGRGLVLMRLSDAIRETQPVAGLQIHRSHWVALAAVARTVRADGRLFVELSDGRRLPISRGYIAAARAAGLRA